MFKKFFYYDFKRNFDFYKVNSITAAHNTSKMNINLMYKHNEFMYFI